MTTPDFGDSVTAAAERDPGYEGWRVTAASGFGVFFAALVVVTFPILLKPLSAEFAWSRQAVSTAFGVTAAMAALCATPLGILLDRIGPRRVIAPSLAAFGILFASLSFLTPNLWHLYAAYAALGVAAMGTSPVAYGRAIVTWFSARRGLALALVITGGALGGILHPPLTEALAHRFGWRGACLALGVAVVVLGVPAVARFVRERPASRGGAAARDGATLGAGLRTRVFWILLVAQLFAIMAQNGVIVHLSALLTDRGVSAARAAIALSAMAGAAVIGRLVTGWLIDRVFAARVLVVTMALAALGAFLLSGAQGFGAGVVAAMLVGFGTGGESDVVPYLLSRYFGLRAFSSLYGLIWTAGAVGSILGPVLMGRAFDLSGSYGPVLVRIAAGVIAAAGVTLMLPRYGATMPASATAAAGTPSASD